MLLLLQATRSLESIQYQEMDKKGVAGIFRKNNCVLSSNPKCVLGPRGPAYLFVVIEMLVLKIKNKHFIRNCSFFKIVMIACLYHYIMCVSCTISASQKVRMNENCQHNTNIDSRLAA
jgi:hypothetical protein